MTIEEARVCLADYNVDPVFRYLEYRGDEEIVEYYSASIVSHNGITFRVGLDDWDGFEESYSTVEEYQRGVALRRQAHHHISHFNANECELGNQCLGYRYWNRFTLEPSIS